MLLSGGARADGVGTQITSLPYTISKSGFYYFGADLSTIGQGIAVTTVDNVTIDLMGFGIAGNDIAQSTALKYLGAATWRSETARCATLAVVGFTP